MHTDSARGGVSERVGCDSRISPQAMKLYGAGGCARGGDRATCLYSIRLRGPAARGAVCCKPRAGESQSLVKVTAFASSFFSSSTFTRSAFRCVRQIPTYYLFGRLFGRQLRKHLGDEIRPECYLSGAVFATKAGGSSLSRPAGLLNFILCANRVFARGSRIFETFSFRAIKLTRLLNIMR